MALEACCTLFHPPRKSGGDYNDFQMQYQKTITTPGVDRAVFVIIQVRMLGTV